MGAAVGVWVGVGVRVAVRVGVRVGVRAGVGVRTSDVGVARHPTVPVGSSAQEFAKTMNDEYEFYRKLVKDAGIKVE